MSAREERRQRWCDIVKRMVGRLTHPDQKKLMKLTTNGARVALSIEDYMELVRMRCEGRHRMHVDIKLPEMEKLAERLGQ